MSLEVLAEKALAGLSPTEALKLFQAPWEVLAEAALLVKARRKGQRVRLVRLLNVKSGGCPEDCAYCAQSAHYSTPAPRYPLLSPEAILQEAKRAKAAGAPSLLPGGGLPDAFPGSPGAGEDRGAFP